MTGASRTQQIGPPEDVRLAEHMLNEAQRMSEAGRYEAAMLYAEAALNLFKLAATKGTVE